jgi:hypothetical protein
MKVEVVCKDTRINELLGVTPMSYDIALSRALIKIDTDDVASSWKDSLVSGRFKTKYYLSTYLKDCFIDRRKKRNYIDYTINQIWSIGGETGWYYGDWLWI